MTEKRRHELRHMLEARRAELESKVHSKLRGFREGDGEAVQGAIAELVDHPANDDVEFALAQMQSQSIVRIKAALDRLEDGEYGTCDHCGDEIPEKRLRALPFATRCHSCQDAAEQVERRRRTGLADLSVRVRAAMDVAGG